MSDPADPVDAGWTALDEERWTDAEQLFRQAIEHDPSCARAWSGLGAACREQHRYPAARAAYERLAVLDERHFFLTMLGAIQNHLGDYVAAITTLRRSLELMPDDDEAHYHLGLALRVSDAGAALAHFEAACRVDFRPANYHREVALTLWKLERFDEALEASERALAGDPTDAFAHHGHGIIQESLDDLAAAKAAHLRAAEIDPACGLVWASAARIAARQRRDREADMLFRRGLANDRESGVVCRHYGQFLQRRGRKAIARDYLQRAVDLDPDDAQARRALAEFEAAGE
jgi:tetratricopeptide (TPR) repeat protein